MPIIFRCPPYNQRCKVDDHASGRRITGPGCDRAASVPVVRVEHDDDHADDTAIAPGAFHFHSGGPAARGPALSGVKRRLSLPWLILVFVFCFLPRSEVGYASKDFQWRVGQSGYQALYWGISYSFDYLTIFLR
jgi:hypothetical protein